MPPHHIAGAILVAVIWGFNFAAIRIGLDSFPPLLMTALRFVGAAIPVLWLARPANAPWRLMLAVAFTWYVGQFVFLFSAMAESVPPGLAAVIVHTQAPLTIVFALLIGERPTAKQATGVGVAVLGLALVGASVGGASVGAVTVIGFGLALMSATSWAVGNILSKRLGKIDLNMVAWLSLLAPLPSLALSLWLEGPSVIVTSIAQASWASWLAIAYLAIMATLVAYLIWGSLLRLYPASAVTPFALLVPVISAIVSYIFFDERFGPLRLSGMALIVAGLAVIAWPTTRSPPRA